VHLILREKYCNEIKATFVLLFRHIQNRLQQCWVIHTQQPLVLLELGYPHMEKELLHDPLRDILDSLSQAVAATCST